MKPLLNKEEKDNKIRHWEKLLTQYYKKSDKHSLKEDLKKAGFKVKDKLRD